MFKIKKLFKRKKLKKFYDLSKLREIEQGIFCYVNDNDIEIIDTGKYKYIIKKGKNK